MPHLDDARDRRSFGNDSFAEEKKESAPWGGNENGRPSAGGSETRRKVPRPPTDAPPRFARRALPPRGGGGDGGDGFGAKDVPKENAPPQPSRTIQNSRGNDGPRTGVAGSAGPLVSAGMRAKILQEQREVALRRRKNQLQSGIVMRSSTTAADRSDPQRTPALQSRFSAPREGNGAMPAYAERQNHGWNREQGQYSVGPSAGGGVAYNEPASGNFRGHPNDHPHGGDYVEHRSRQNDYYPSEPRRRNDCYPSEPRDGNNGMSYAHGQRPYERDPSPQFETDAASGRSPVRGEARDPIGEDEHSRRRFEGDRRDRPRAVEPLRNDPLTDLARSPARAAGNDERVAVDRDAKRGEPNPSREGEMRDERTAGADSKERAADDDRKDDAVVVVRRNREEKREPRLRRSSSSLSSFARIDENASTEHADSPGKIDKTVKLVAAAKDDSKEHERDEVDGPPGDEKSNSFCVRDLRLDDPESMKSFLLSPLSKCAGTLQCYIKRHKSGRNKLHPEYRLYLKEGDTFLMTSKKRAKKKTSNYLLSMSRNDHDKNSASIVGKLRANFLGTEFQIYDAGRNPRHSDPYFDEKNDEDVRSELGAVMYGSNVIGSRGPRKMQVCVNRVDEHDGTSTRVWRPVHRDEEMISCFKNGIESAMRHLVVLENRPPRWNEQLGAYVLNFNGRVTMASVKNFQLTEKGGDEDDVVLQFGRVAKDEFTLDFHWPVSPLQAFAVSLSSLDSKIACD